MSEEKFKYRLTWSGRPDSETTRAAFEHVKEWPLAKDSKLQLINYIDFRMLVTNGQVRSVDFWNVREGEIGAISLTWYVKHTDTWDMINNAKSDFEKGWAACEKKHKYLEDWNEAIAHTKVRNEWLACKKRTFRLNVTEADSVAFSLPKRLPEIFPRVLSAKYGSNRRGESWMDVIIKCTGPEIEKLFYEMSDDYHCYHWQFPNLEDPTKEETKRTFTYNHKEQYYKAVRKGAK